MTSDVCTHSKNAESISDINHTAHKRLKAKQYAEVVRLFDTVLDQNYNDTFALNHKGYALIDLERYDEAIGCFDRVLVVNKNLEHSHYM